MIWLLAAAAFAGDPAAMRAPLVAGSLAADAAGANLSVAAEGADGQLLAVVRPEGGVLVGPGLRRRLTDEERSWHVHAWGWLGAGATTLRPAPVLSAMGAVGGGYTGTRWHGGLALVTAPGWRIAETSQLAVPLFVEPRASVRVGTWQLGARAELGATLVAGGPPAIRARAGLAVVVPLGTWNGEDPAQ